MVMMENENNNNQSFGYQYLSRPELGIEPEFVEVLVNKYGYKSKISLSSIDIDRDINDISAGFPFAQRSLLRRAINELKENETKESDIKEIIIKTEPDDDCVIIETSSSKIRPKLELIPRRENSIVEELAKKLQTAEKNLLDKEKELEKTKEVLNKTLGNKSELLVSSSVNEQQNNEIEILRTHGNSFENLSIDNSNNIELANSETSNGISLNFMSLINDYIVGESNKTVGYSRRLRSRTKTNQKFVCMEAGCKVKNFDSSERLKEHIKSIHNAIPEFKCDYENCTKGFVKRELLNRHLKRHTAVKKFKCTSFECVMSFITKSELESHIGYVHKDEKLFECKACRKRFGGKNQLKDHRNQKHSMMKT